MDNIPNNEWNNNFLDTYVQEFIKPFRKYNKDVFEIIVSGLGTFIVGKNYSKLLNKLNDNDFIIKFVEPETTITSLHIAYTNITNSTCGKYNFQIQDLPSLIEMSGRANISLYDIIIMKIVSQLICQYRIIYKAIVLDLDDTVWPGTLAEDGIGKIKENISSIQGTPYIAFLRFVKGLAEELGIFIAICSKNDSESVKYAIESIDDEIFPIKYQIDCIVANNNDKSENIKYIASQLSILPNAIVFIDDNQIVRDEVKKQLPEVFVPEWKNHYELMTMLAVSGIFDRNELSLNSQNRRRQLKILQVERMQNKLPRLMVKANKDNEHIQAKKLYSKSNQFKLVSEQIDFTDSESIFFEMYRLNGENLGICSAITYSKNNSTCSILNWAISCRYFEIGLEEFVILYVLNNISDNLHFVCQLKKENIKIQQFIDKYSQVHIFDSNACIPINSDMLIEHFKEEYSFGQLLMKLKNGEVPFQVYWLHTDSYKKELLTKNTNLELL